MTFTPLIEREEIRKAYMTFAESMSKGSIPLTRTLSWRGDHTEVILFWHDKLGFWSHFDPEGDDSYWCVFGVQNAAELIRLHINCEINMPKEGINRSFAGLFVRDNTGNIYITHNGNLRGGREGISKSNFLKFVPHDAFISPIWQDKEEYKTILIGRLDDPELPNLVSHYVKKVYRFKEQVFSDKLQKSIDWNLKTFSPEFSGPRKSYRQTDVIKSQVNHGLIIDALLDLLETRGLKTTNDNLRDLFIYDDAGSMTVLFEVKTDTSTTSIYGAIGQLMYHGAVQKVPPKRVLVIPDDPKLETTNVLNRLGIGVITYRWKEGDVVFSYVDDILKEATT